MLTQTPRALVTSYARGARCPGLKHVGCLHLTLISRAWRLRLARLLRLCVLMHIRHGRRDLANVRDLLLHIPARIEMRLCAKPRPRAHLTKTRAIRDEIV